MTTTKDDYLQLIDTEEGELFIVSLVEHIVQRSQDVLFEKHIESQVLPYAVQFAKETIDEIVEWHFFRRDPGDIDPCTWEPDEEPEPAIIDSWAPGAIPVRRTPLEIIKPTPPPVLETRSASTVSMQSEASQEIVETAPVASQRPSVAGSANIKASAGSLVSSRERKISIRDSRTEMMSAASLAASTTSTAARRRIGSSGSGGRRGGALKDAGQPPPLSAAQVAEMAIQEENKRVLARLRNLEKDGGKPVDWSYDHEGRIVVVKKVGSGKAVGQGIKSRLLPVDTSAVPVNSSKSHPQPPRTPPAASSAAETTTARYAHQKRSIRQPRKATDIGERKGPSLPPKAKSSTSKQKQRKSKEGASGSIASLLGALNHGAGFVEDVALEVPSLAETMKVAPGVILREGDLVKRGPSLPKGPPHPTSSFQSTASKFLPAPATPPTSIDPLAKVLSRARPTIRRVPLAAQGLAPLPGIATGGSEKLEGDASDKRQQKGIVA
ncbi:uncharacterized protein SPPG_02971 [Spizellomyces punctatus DAOM BR117]|uniref:Uncharacterized protein n=1 Tax=Spizellomyces punctatus (strain DAOM BR117) TaxID=645134 RepID=A0A0L0HN73_SPIPD|nr:uncharacterized protein SPPG_02971 [Spizellomyces punctatus DAOM BR117]KND02513.1 hypothetical protein SPPG_02971 [Spizellomyces punctatus DAOM BR117]|eukprot:XP_016610552.1 hypothetical protein SPPG_02971 [Spizellomyces punctatus DAOM BR117]